MRMFRRPRPAPAPHEIYASGLQRLSVGHALWFPEPHESGEPQVGDVGFIREGAFVRLFNLDPSATEKAVTHWEPCPAFKVEPPLPEGALKTYRTSGVLFPGHHCSHGVESKNIHTSADVNAGPNVSANISIHYTCKEEQGAALELKSEADSESTYDNHLLKTYIAQNCSKWHAYAKDVLGQDVKEEDIIVVSGWVKTKLDWAANAFSNTSSASGGSAGVSAGGIVGVQAGGEHSYSTTGPKMHRHGKHYSEVASSSSPAETERNQCIFLKYYKVLRRLIGLPKIVAGAGYHRLPDPGDRRSGQGEKGGVAGEVEDLDEADILELQGNEQALIPLDILLDYILETINVGIAVASNQDVESITGGNMVVDFASYLRKVQPPVEVDETVGSLRMEHVISHERERAIACRTVTAPDLAKWLNITSESAGHLEDTLVFIPDPMREEGRRLKLKHLIFADSHSQSGGSLCSALSADGKLLAASFDTSDIIVWRLSDGLLVQHLQHQGHTDYVRSLSFSPISRTLVSGSHDRSAIVWDILSGRVLLRLEGHSGRVHQVAYSSNGALIATACDNDKSVKLWDALTGACIQSLDVHDSIYKVAFSPDSLHLHAEVGTSVLIYNIPAYAHTATLEIVAEDADDWSISCQGDRIVGASGDKVTIRSAVTGDEILTVVHPRKLSGPVAFSPDGTEVLAGCNADEAAVTYDSRTGQLRRTLKLSHSAHRAAYSPDGDYVVVGDMGDELRIFDAKSGVFLAKFEAGGDHTDIQFVPNAQTLLIQLDDGPLRLCNIQDIMRMR